GQISGSEPVPLVLILGQNGWSVTYTSTQICALKGSTVDMRCSYSYPSTVHNITPTVQDRFWFVKNNEKPVHLKSHSHRFEYRFHENDCTLRITGLRERDSAEYKFRFKTNQDGGSFTGSPGVTLTVTDLQVKVRRSSTQTELQCHTSCHVTDPPSYVWYNKGQKLKEETSSLRVSVRDDDSSYSCAVKGHEDHRLYYMLVSPSAETVEGSSITLNCGFTANPAANYTWYKGNSQRYLSEGTVLGLESIQPSDSGEYYCTAENELGRTSESIFINVKYPPKLVSVSASSSNEIKEGRSVTLTCNSDANPAAEHFWYKDGDPNPLSNERQLSFSSVQSSDSGEYFCAAENNLGRRTSESIVIVVICEINKFFFFSFSLEKFYKFTNYFQYF
uniref:B-cell receptor CD22 n=1 Tax=Amphilophus citrinellus TaxID=61819 RepID=A0A3Q0T1L0_AMPCI